MLRRSARVRRRHALSASILELRLDFEWPRVNGKFISRIFSHVEERRGFLHNVGLLEMGTEVPADGLAHFGRRLHELGIATEVEPIDPEALVVGGRAARFNATGLYDRCGVFLTERPKFTLGLERELEKLQKELVGGAVGKAALRVLFDDAEPLVSPQATSEVEKLDLVEVVPLNDEQRSAVRSAFRNPLTVVTGPPGTGKSQVVVSALVNAHPRGESVLFTSRNNEAVDVVEARVNGLSSGPLVVRVGGKSPAKDFHGELLRFLTQLLSIASTGEDRRAHADALEEMDMLKARRNDLWRRAEEMRRARNRVWPGGFGCGFAAAGTPSASSTGPAVTGSTPICSASCRRS